MTIPELERVARRIEERGQSSNDVAALILRRLPRPTPGQIARRRAVLIEAARRRNR